MLPSSALCIVHTSTQSATGFATLIPDRQTKTIILIIERVLRPGSIIHTDEARVFQRLDKSEIGYAHETICHKYYFVCPQSGVYTQHVESWNNKLKCKKHL